MPETGTQYYPTKEDMKDPERLFQVVTRAFQGINEAHEQLAGKSTTSQPSSGGASKGAKPAAAAAAATPTSAMLTSLGPAQPPASSSAAGVPGSIVWDSGFVYICTAAGTWKRAALSAF